MDPEKMEATLERIDHWRTEFDNGWLSDAVAERFEAGARGEVFTELVKSGPRLAKWPASKELISALYKTSAAKARFLDFGCANGIYGDLLQKFELTKSWEYVGVDINPDLIASCQQRYPQRSFLCLTPNSELPFDDDSFDVVFASGVLEFIQDTRWILKEFSRVSKATIVLSRISYSQKPAAVFLQKVRHTWGIEQHCFHLFNETELHLAIESVGLTIADRTVSEACGEWTLPDDPDPIPAYTYVLEKDQSHLREEIEKARKTAEWAERCMADLVYEVNSLRERLEQSQAVREELAQELEKAESELRSSGT